MISLVLGGIFGIAVLLVIFATLLRREPRDVDQPVKLPEQTVVDRFFSQIDLDYVRAAHCSEALRLFMRERRFLALAWLDEVRRAAVRLVRLHAQQARHLSNLSLKAECRFALNVTLFFSIFLFVRALIWGFGPFRTRRLLQHVIWVGDRLKVFGNGRLSQLRVSGQNTQ